MNLQRINEWHADIPAFPEQYSESSEYYWYYGFAASIQEIRAIVQHYSPESLITPDGSVAPDMTFLTSLHQFCMAASRWWYMLSVLVQPVPENADNVQTLYPAPNGQPTVFFFSVVATQEDFLAMRPDKEQMNRLVKIFQKEPEWREDAIPKSEWAEYYDI